MNTLDIAQATKSEKIDEAVRLATRMQEAAIEHAHLLRQWADDNPDPSIDERMGAVAQIWVERKDELRSFLAMAIPADA